MTSPFVQHALDLWHTVQTEVDTLPKDPSIGVGAVVIKVEQSGVTFDDKGSMFKAQRMEAFAGPSVAAAFQRIFTALHQLQHHLAPYPLLGAQTMTCTLYYDGPKLSFGPWAKYAFHIHGSITTSDFLAQAVALAEADGTGPGHVVPLNHNRAQTHTARANVDQHAYALFALCGENLHIFRTTSTTATPDRVTIPVCTPCPLPDHVWTTLWDAVQTARSAGVRWGRVEMWPQAHQLVTQSHTAERSKTLDKAIATFTSPPHHKTQDQAIATVVGPKMQAVEQAVLDLVREARQRAPILGALDTWCITNPMAVMASYAAGDAFTWGPKSCSLKLMAGGSIWGDNHPVNSSNEARFRYGFERALGVLATLPGHPTHAWIAPNEALLPGDTVQDAALLSVALASGNKPGYVPGATIKAKDLGGAPWTLAQRAV